MNEQTLTPYEAWRDFWAIKKTLPAWQAATIDEKKYLDKTNRQVRNGIVRAARIKKALETYAPGVYQYHEAEPFFTK